MLSRRNILPVLGLVHCLLAHSTGASEALDHFHARLDEIARNYNQQFAEIQKNRGQSGAGKMDRRAAEQQIKELGLQRTRAIAEAERIYRKEKEPIQERADASPAPKVSLEQQQRESLAARRQTFEEGQKAFWTRVAQNEPKIAALWAARLQVTEEQQRAFWAELPLRAARDAELQEAQRKAVGKAQAAFWAKLFESPQVGQQSPAPPAHAAALDKKPALLQLEQSTQNKAELAAVYRAQNSSF